MEPIYKHIHNNNEKDMLFDVSQEDDIYSESFSDNNECDLNYTENIETDRSYKKETYHKCWLSTIIIMSLITVFLICSDVLVFTDKQSFTCTKTNSFKSMKSYKIDDGYINEGILFKEDNLKTQLITIMSNNSLIHDQYYKVYQKCRCSITFDYIDVYSLNPYNIMCGYMIYNYSILSLLFFIFSLVYYTMYITALFAYSLL